MHRSLVGSILGLGTFQLIVVLVILLVFFSGTVTRGGGDGSRQRGADARLTAHEKQVLYILAALAALGFGIIAWRIYTQ